MHSISKDGVRQTGDSISRPGMCNLKNTPIQPPVPGKSTQDWKTRQAYGRGFLLMGQPRLARWPSWIEQLTKTRVHLGSYLQGNAALVLKVALVAGQCNDDVRAAIQCQLADLTPPPASKIARTESVPCKWRCSQTQVCKAAKERNSYNRIVPINTYLFWNTP